MVVYANKSIKTKGNGIKYLLTLTAIIKKVLIDLNKYSKIIQNSIYNNINPIDSTHRLRCFSLNCCATSL